MAGSGRHKADDAMLMALACGATSEVAAGVGVRTVTRRLTDPEFSRRLEQLKLGMFQRAAAMLTASSMESVKTLLELQKPAVPFAVRLGAARSALEIGAKFRETAELEKRLQALEEQLLLNAANP